ncbi:hypothetical protein ACFIJ5_17115 [Haloimpatiens sp. FM7330]
MVWSFCHTNLQMNTSKKQNIFNEDILVNVFFGLVNNNDKYKGSRGIE